MNAPQKMSNDVLAIALELWLELNVLENNRNLTVQQEEYFREIIWRLKLMPDMEKEDNGRK